jgi:hypothetical protein
MRPRRIAMVLALAVMVVLLALVALQRAGRSAAPDLHAVKLRDGRALEGMLMRLHESTYLVQTNDACVIVSPDEVLQVDGKDLAALQLPASAQVPLSQETYEEIQPDGSIELRSVSHVPNAGSDILSSVSWGMAPHELSDLEHERVIDQYGDELPMRIEDHPTVPGGKLVRVDLPRPVLPGESITLTMIVRSQRPDAKAFRDGDAWVYRNVGDYPDGRLVTRAVRLPAGARIISVRPEPLHRIDAGDRPVVIWRRYFLRGELAPWEIRYRL